MDQCHYMHQISDAVINIKYDQVIHLITLYPNYARIYLMAFVSDIIVYRDKSVYTKKWAVIIDMCKFLYERITAEHFNQINYILLKWAVDTCNLEIVKYVVSLHKKFNTQFSIVELLNDESDEFFNLTNEILYYLVRKNKEYGIMKISKYYGYLDNMPFKRLANMGVEAIDIILI